AQPIVAQNGDTALSVPCGGGDAHNYFVVRLSEPCRWTFGDVHSSVIPDARLRAIRDPAKHPRVVFPGSRLCAAKSAWPISPLSFAEREALGGRLGRDDGGCCDLLRQPGVDTATRLGASRQASIGRSVMSSNVRSAALRRSLSP